MSSVGPLAAGFRQTPAGSYVTIVSSINVTNVLQAPVKSGSGGAATMAAPATYVFSSTGSPSTFSTCLTAGHVLKDMGSVEVSSLRVFRKFKAVAPAVDGTNGDAGNTTTFGTFYLEVAADGGDVPPAKASVLARSL